MTRPLHQELLGGVISTEVPPGRMLPPTLFEPPWPLVQEPEIWIAAVGDADWGGGEVLVSEDDDDYRRYVSPMSGSMTVGTLLDAIPEAAAHQVYEPLTFRVRLHGRRELVAMTPADAIARRNDLLLVTPQAPGRCEIIATTATRLVDTIDGDHVYECSGPCIRGGYGSGRTKAWTLRLWTAGTVVVRLDRTVFRFGYEPRHVGQRLWFKLPARNVYGDADATEDPIDAEPVSIDVRGTFYQRDPRRWLA